jgi:hypothetical protein
LGVPNISLRKVRSMWFLKGLKEVCSGLLLIILLIVAILAGAGFFCMIYIGAKHLWGEITASIIITALLVMTFISSFAYAEGQKYREKKHDNRNPV